MFLPSLGAESVLSSSLYWRLFLNPTHPHLVPQSIDRLFVAGMHVSTNHFRKRFGLEESVRGALVYGYYLAKIVLRLLEELQHQIL